MIDYLKDSDYDSDEEIMFAKWLIEAEKEGYVKDVNYHNKTYNLLEPVKVDSVRLSKKTDKVSNAKRHLMGGMNYTPDFIFSLTPKFIKKFYKSLNIFSSFKRHIQDYYVSNIEWDEFYMPMEVDTKGSFAGKKNSSAITFPLKQKILQHLKGVYVQKIIPQKWFQSTWVPVEFAYMKNRKVKTLTKLGKKCKLLSEIN